MAASPSSLLLSAGPHFSFSSSVMSHQSSMASSYASHVMLRPSNDGGIFVVTVWTCDTTTGLCLCLPTQAWGWLSSSYSMAMFAAESWDAQPVPHRRTGKQSGRRECYEPAGKARQGAAQLRFSNLSVSALAEIPSFATKLRVYGLLPVVAFQQSQRSSATASAPADLNRGWNRTSGFFQGASVQGCAAVTHGSRL